MDDNPSFTNVLTDRLLRSWLRCRRKAWLDKYEDPKKRLWSAHRALQLDQQQRHFNSFLNKKPRSGLASLESGESAVIGLRIKSNIFHDLPLEIHPPLLHKVEGKSKWGDFHYVPVISRQGKRATKEHRLTLAITGKLLGFLQEKSVKYGVLIGGYGPEVQLERIFLTRRLDDQLTKSLMQLNSDLKSSMPPAIINNRKKCALCSWRGLCNAEASSQGSLNEVSGIGSKRSQTLHEIGIKNIEILATSDSAKLQSKLSSLGIKDLDLASNLVNQAKVQMEKKPKRIKHTEAIPELTKTQGIFLYDIESDPDHHEEYLHGFVKLIKDQNSNWNFPRSRYHPLLVIQNENKKSLCAWKRISKKIFSKTDFPILHYGETEAIALCQMAKRHGVSEDEINQLKKRMIDVHLRLKETWLLPISSYSLKSVANWIGFQWSKEGVDGARALVWWRHWKGSGTNSRGHINNLKWIFEYNYEDNLATLAVISWLMSEDIKLKQKETTLMNQKDLRSP